MEQDLSEPLILGRSWLAEIHGVASPAHQLIKFKYQGEVITIRADHETNLRMVWLPYPDEPYMKGPPPDPNSAWPVGGWIDQWEDEAPDFQGFRDLTDSNAARGYSQVYHTGLSRPTSL